MVEAIKEANSQGLTQNRACGIFGLSTRKYRRWANPKPRAPRVAWNKIRPEERARVIETACDPDFWGKPMSHIFVHGQDSGSFFMSLASVYNILKKENLVRRLPRKKRGAPYVSAHSLMDEGFSLLCYDATRFSTETGVSVWSIPVMILPQRYLLDIGYSLNGVSAKDLARALKEALASLPEHLFEKLIAHSDRGSAMKAALTKNVIKELLGAPVHYGRPRTPDDQAWIEAFIKTLKYHREAPESFATVDDIVRWFARFKDIYNNDPHSSLNYVTPLQALAGKQEVILNQRRQNLIGARCQRYAAWKKAETLRAQRPFCRAAEVVTLPA